MLQSHNDQFPVLLKRQLKMRSSIDGTLNDIVIEIGQPYWKEEDLQAACPVAIRGYLGRVSDISGIDPIAAMKEAIRFVESFLEKHNEGQAFFWPDGEEY